MYFAFNVLFSVVVVFSTKLVQRVHQTIIIINWIFVVRHSKGNRFEEEN